MSDSEELIRRLRELEWPAVGADLRQRCWEEFSRRLVAERLPVAEPRAQRATGERYAFTRRPLGIGDTASPVTRSRIAIASRMTRAGAPRRLLSAA